MLLIKHLISRHFQFGLNCYSSICDFQFSTCDISGINIYSLESFVENFSLTNTRNSNNDSLSLKYRYVLSAWLNITHCSVPNSIDYRLNEIVETLTFTRKHLLWILHSTWKILFWKERLASLLITEIAMLMSWVWYTWHTIK